MQCILRAVFMVCKSGADGAWRSTEVLADGPKQNSLHLRFLLRVVPRAPFSP
jgi:hypothetical protein